MTDNGGSGEGNPPDYEAMYKQVVAERDAYANKLNEYVDANNKLNAELKVQQSINRKTLGVSSDPPKEDKGESIVSLKDKIADLRARALKGENKK